MLLRRTRNWLACRTIYGRWNCKTYTYCILWCSASATSTDRWCRGEIFAEINSASNKPVTAATPMLIASPVLRVLLLTLLLWSRLFASYTVMFFDPSYRCSWLPAIAWRHHDAIVPNELFIIKLHRRQWLTSGFKGCGRPHTAQDQQSQRSRSDFLISVFS